MSLKTWMEEFYPSDATDAISSDLEAIEHSLQKWKGAVKENVERHGLVYENHEIDNKLKSRKYKDYFQFDSLTCSLCQRYNSEFEKQLEDEGYSNYPPCYSNRIKKYCPIVHLRKGHACDEPTPSEKQAPWEKSLYNPQPMIELLEQTKQFILGSTNE